jgi:hypothetical protein
MQLLFVSIRKVIFYIDSRLGILIAVQSTCLGIFGVTFGWLAGWEERASSG